MKIDQEEDHLIIQDLEVRALTQVKEWRKVEVEILRNMKVQRN